MEGERPRNVLSKHSSVPNGACARPSMIALHSSAVGDQGWSSSPMKVDVVA